mmetsp:Transcript_27034/g.62946  ORF Transcript_27034/g.62946 Transcript_27034/m.62946 type:complete len:395 (-) Transcript_27034:107-1291(-)
MAVGETTPLVQETGLLAPTIVLGVFYSAAGIYQVFSVFVADKIAQTLGSSVGFVSLCQSLFWLGYAAATVLLLPFLDTYGRRGPLFVCGWIGLAAAMMSLTTHTELVYAVCQFLIGFFMMPTGNVAFVIAQEILPETRHNSTLAFYNVSYSILGIAMAAASYSCNGSQISWQIQELFWYLPIVAALTAGPFFIHESLETLDKTQKLLPRQEDVSLFRPPVSKLTGALMICWLAVATGFYGLSYNSGNLAPDIYLNMGLLSCIDLVFYSMSLPIIDNLGKREALATVLMGTSILMLMCAVLPEKSWTLMCVSLLARLCLDVGFASVFLLLADFPACLRVSALGAANTVARLGCASAPLLALLPTSASCVGLSVLALLASGAAYSICEGEKEVAKV